MAPGMSLYSVQAILILSADDGSRIFAKYYDQGIGGQTSGAALPPNPYPDKASQLRFEKGLLAKTAKQSGDILLFDGKVVLYKFESDVGIFVVGGAEENEILLYNVILAIRDSFHLLFKQSVDRRTIVENFDLVSLAIDEIVDSGIVMETDPTIILHRCSRAPTQDVNLTNIDPFSEQGVNNLAQLGRTKLAGWLRQGL
ncbi:Longin-like domain containing protein [Rhypophila sp. PSN 637]|uniref:Coatomer subunit zeta n=1 Tax=Rhypophila decipiens TaxID=261697 RepID=A0AAN7B8X2_9PEZI|nr:Longin-like domain-containing protein [Rhypophila decipiens]